MKLDKYDGPRYRFKPFHVAMGALPVCGAAWAAGAFVFLMDERGERETTSVPAAARGTVLVGAVSTVVYAVAVLVGWFL